MIVDASAVVAILRNEPEADAFTQALERASRTRAGARISAVSFVEAAIVIDGNRDPIISRRFDEFIKESRILIEPVTIEQAQIAREAFRDFGRGSGHPAKLNFGDCFSYALASATGEPLLFKGNDFSRTDLKVAR
ncbi:MAG TPA: type II toxin-antitoxin system VapC family toxin [Bryobacteraceae bacterium]|nr:type II toxin-antitoxin system VapC family toxin [Bryobacteraceae bacterium]